MQTALLQRHVSQHQPRAAFHAERHVRGLVRAVTEERAPDERARAGDQCAWAGGGEDEGRGELDRRRGRQRDVRGAACKRIAQRRLRGHGGGHLRRSVTQVCDSVRTVTGLSHFAPVFLLIVRKKSSEAADMHAEIAELDLRIVHLF